MYPRGIIKTELRELLGHLRSKRENSDNKCPKKKKKKLLVIKLGVLERVEPTTGTRIS